MILDLPPVLATRRNHALEHATLHVLEDRQPDRHLAGHSNPTGFFIFANVTTEELKNSITQALTRLRSGESNLAIHAGCGTNMATSLLMSSFFAFLPVSGRKSTLWRVLMLPVGVLFAVVGYALSQPLGPWLQANVTTEADMGDLRVLEVVPVRKGVHRVMTAAA
ncbi:MAG TPA: DUF6391 domain-containing protein [Anaerolineales bacterium]